MASSIGYLEEMYMGTTGEILYRPFGKNWAIGAEANLALKRDPLSSFALLPNGDHILSGFFKWLLRTSQHGRDPQSKYRALSGR